MDDVETLKREMAGLKRDFAKFQRQFKELQAEFQQRAKDIHASLKRTDQLMWVHMRDMEEFGKSQQKRLARQRDRESKVVKTSRIPGRN
jgi:DNA anti-recombination protein RmuC